MPRHGLRACRDRGPRFWSCRLGVDRCFHSKRERARRSGDPVCARKASPPLQPGEVVSARKLRDRGRTAPRREHRPAAVPSRGWRRTPMRQWQIEWLSVAVALRSRATTATPRASRSRRSLIAWVALRRRSRRTSTTRRARRHGRSRPATRGLCRGCGAYTQPRNGKGDAYAYCKVCHPGAIERRWTRERVLDAMREWRARYGRLPSSYDWSHTHAHRRGGEPLERLSGGEWPSASVVTGVYGSWQAARAVAAEQIVEAGDQERRSPDRRA